MKDTIKIKTKKRDFSVYPQICVRTTEATASWLRAGAEKSKSTIGGFLDELRLERSHVNNLFNQKKTAKKESSKVL
jgi:hypothetical protein